MADASSSSPPSRRVFVVLGLASVALSASAGLVLDALRSPIPWLASDLGLIVSPILAAAAGLPPFLWAIWLGAKTAGPAVPGGWSPPPGFAFASIGLVFGMALGLAIARPSGIYDLLDFAPMGVLVASFLLLASCKPRRGNDRFCPQCGYEFNYANLDAAPERCPECNAAWLKRLVVGRRELDRTRLSLGLCLLLIWGGITSLSFIPAARKAVYAAVPSQLLIGRATAYKPGFRDETILRVLESRTLTPEQINRLASGLLDLRRDHDSLTKTEDDYFTWRISAGTLSSDLVTRYFEERAAPFLMVHDATGAGLGESTAFLLRTKDNLTPFTTLEAYYWIESVEALDAQGSPLPVTAPLGEWLDYFSLAADWRVVLPTRHIVVQRGSQPPPVTLRVTVWRVASTLPLFTAQAPVTPLGRRGGPPPNEASVVWSKRETLELTTPAAR